MKTFIISTVAVSLAAISWGQQQGPGEVTSGKITYEETIKVNIEVKGDDAQLLSNLPKERKAEKILTFNSDAALYEDGVNTDEDMESPEGTVRIRMVVSGQNKIYTDLKDNKVTEQRDFMNRIFLVEKEMPEPAWKITGNQKTILGYQCMEAVKTDTAGKKTIAWFSPSIPVKAGPSGLCNLPGAILEADIDNGQRTYAAKSVTPLSGKELKIQKPKEGKKVTEAEYEKVVSDKMKEMGIEQGAGQGGGTHMQIVIKRQ